MKTGLVGARVECVGMDSVESVDVKFRLKTSGKADQCRFSGIV